LPHPIPGDAACEASKSYAKLLARRQDGKHSVAALLILERHTLPQVWQQANTG